MLQQPSLRVKRRDGEDSTHSNIIQYITTIGTPGSGWVVKIIVALLIKFGSYIHFHCQISYYNTSWLYFVSKSSSAR